LATVDGGRVALPVVLYGGPIQVTQHQLSESCHQDRSGRGFGLGLETHQRLVSKFERLISVPAGEAIVSGGEGLGLGW